MIVGVIFGGRSAEHEISILSAKNVVEALEKSGFNTALIGIDKDGKWYHILNREFLKEVSGVENAILPAEKEQIIPLAYPGRAQFLDPVTGKPFDRLDVLFPILHGTFGEDGTIQGLFSLMDVPFVGSSVLGSAVGMDKDVMKRLLRDAGIPVPDFLVFRENEKDKIRYRAISRYHGDNLFVKPANLGSSMKKKKTTDEESFYEAAASAFDYDTKIIVEEAIEGREIECSVLGNDEPVASLPGEVIPKYDFYSYEAKYIDENGAELVIPAELNEDEIKLIQKTSVKAFKSLCLEGLARVDGFLTKNGEFLVNEVNTIPGFTMRSMYPKLLEASGIPQHELVKKLIELAVESFEKKKVLKRSI